MFIDYIYSNPNVKQLLSLFCLVIQQDFRNELQYYPFLREVFKQDLKELIL